VPELNLLHRSALHCPTTSDSARWLAPVHLLQPFCYMGEIKKEKGRVEEGEWRGVRVRRLHVSQSVVTASVQEEQADGL
jgi:hypothetical protein